MSGPDVRAVLQDAHAAATHDSDAGRAEEAMQAIAALDRLLMDAERAAIRLEQLATQFAQMTDRHGDGNACRYRAYTLRQSIAEVKGEAP